MVIDEHDNDGGYFPELEHEIQENPIQGNDCQSAPNTDAGVNLDRIQAILSRIDNADPQKKPFRNISKKNIESVDRHDRNVSVIGDLHGSYKAFETTLLDMGLVKNTEEGLKWIGGNRELVFLGDILADRHNHGLEIYAAIRRLKPQVLEAGGNIHMVCGNHDSWALSLIVPEVLEEAFSSPWTCLTNSNQGLGLIEFNAFMSGNEDLVDVVDKGKCQVLEGMKQNPEGREILEQLKNLKIVEQIDDTLFFHCDPEDEILELIVKIGVDKINYIFQEVIRRAIDGEEIDKNLLPDFIKICKTFLRTSNERMSHKILPFHSVHSPLCRALRAMGINTIVHGHSGIEDIKEYSLSEDRDEQIRVVNADSGAFKSESYDIFRSAVEIESKKGEIRGFSKKSLLIEHFDVAQVSDRVETEEIRGKNSMEHEFLALDKFSILTGSDQNMGYRIDGFVYGQDAVRLDVNGDAIQYFLYPGDYVVVKEFMGDREDDVIVYLIAEGIFPEHIKITYLGSKKLRIENLDDGVVTRLYQHGKNDYEITLTLPCNPNIQHGIDSCVTEITSPTEHGCMFDVDNHNLVVIMGMLLNSAHKFMVMKDLNGKGVSLVIPGILEPVILEDDESIMFGKRPSSGKCTKRVFFRSSSLNNNHLSVKNMGGGIVKITDMGNSGGTRIIEKVLIKEPDPET